MIPNFSNPMASLNQFMPNWAGNQSPTGGGNWMNQIGDLVPAAVQKPAVNAGLVTDPTWSQKAFGYTDGKGIANNGWAGTALGGAQALGGAFLGMKQYGMAKKQLSESKRQFDTNFAAQKQMVNMDLEDRQKARVASNPGAYESVGSYMNNNKVK